MRHKLIAILLLMIAVIIPLKSEAADKELVILDSDMVDMFDDGVAMMMLAKAPNVKLLGVTVSTGNNWAQNGTASAIRQLEGIGVTDVPVVEGSTPKAIRKRFANLQSEIDQFGYGFDQYYGFASHEEPADWKSAYRKNYGAEPTLEPLNGSPADFIILMVRAHPNEITIVEIGPCTNLAAAIKKAPDIVPLIKRVVYMGGAFFQMGNVTPAAEFNIWFDPPAAKQCFRAAFNEQIIVPLDACEKVVLDRDEFKRIIKGVKSPIIAELNDRVMSKYDSKQMFVWDILAAAVVIDPTIIIEEETMPVDVNDVYSPSYGETLAYRTAPRGAQTARIVTTVNQFKLRTMLDKMFSSI
ncbi:MAG: nucleoside hydrolase [Selenomonadaceae bacterium]|nr:nucleoside hydrolase [Selenomonadaceae bacterium]